MLFMTTVIIKGASCMTCLVYLLFSPMNFLATLPYRNSLPRRCVGRDSAIQKHRLASAMLRSADFVLRLEGILPTGLCLSFGSLFLGLFSYAAFLGPPVAEQATSCAGAAARLSSSRG